jgi:hypothetical protein
MDDHDQTESVIRIDRNAHQLGDLAEATKGPDIQYIDDPCRTIDPGFNQAQDPPHPRTPGQQPIGQSYHLRPYPPTFWTLPCRSQLPPTLPFSRLDIFLENGHRV